MWGKGSTRRVCFIVRESGLLNLWYINYFCIVLVMLWGGLFPWLEPALAATCSEVVNDLSRRPAVTYCSDHCSAATTAPPGRASEREEEEGSQRRRLRIVRIARRCAHVPSEAVLRLRSLWDASPVFSRFFCSARKTSAGRFFSLQRRLVPDVRPKRLMGGKMRRAFYYNNKRRHICFVFFFSLKASFQLCNVTAADSRRS